MALLKRLSSSIWSYVSPVKSNQDLSSTATPKPISHYGQGAAPAYRRALSGTIGRGRSMSANEKVDTWHTSQGWTAGKKRKLVERSIPDTDHTRKFARVSESKTGRNFEVDSDGGHRRVRKEEDTYTYNNVVEPDKEEEEALSGGVSSIRMGATSASELSEHSEVDYGKESDEHNRNSATSTDHGSAYESEINEEDDDNKPTFKHKYELPVESPEYLDPSLTTPELRAQGWDDDHIVLVQRIALRGYEPIMPADFKGDFRHMPDGLFSDTSEAIVGSVRGKHFRAIRAIEGLFVLGARVRERVAYRCGKTPEQTVRIHIRAYMKWAMWDAELDPNSAIPLLAIQIGDRTVPSAVLQTNAERKLANIANRYREAFRIKQSIEQSPASGSTQLSYDIPTLYAIVASGTLVALVAYRPDDAQPQINSIALFDMKDNRYDVWNAFALAMVVCHLRNLQMRIAEETGLGTKGPRNDDEQGSDDDSDDARE